MKTPCTHCNTELDLQSFAPGSYVSCPTCSSTIEVPRAPLDEKQTAVDIPSNEQSQETTNAPQGLLRQAVGFFCDEPSPKYLHPGDTRCPHCYRRLTRQCYISEVKYNCSYCNGILIAQSLVVVPLLTPKQIVKSYERDATILSTIPFFILGIIILICGGYLSHINHIGWHFIISILLTGMLYFPARYIRNQCMQTAILAKMLNKPSVTTPPSSGESAHPTSEGEEA